MPKEHGKRVRITSADHSLEKIAHPQTHRRRRSRGAGSKVFRDQARTSWPLLEGASPRYALNYVTRIHRVRSHLSKQKLKECSNGWNGRAYFCSLQKHRWAKIAHQMIRSSARLSCHIFHWSPRFAQAAPGKRPCFQKLNLRLSSIRKGDLKNQPPSLGLTSDYLRKRLRRNFHERCSQFFYSDVVGPISF